jgi:eukaryotic-like serine/threonine-protein kinase
MPEPSHEAELVADEELVFDDPIAPTLLRRERRQEALVREGEVLAGKYRVERIPGRAGLGVIVQVRHLELGQEVTLKFLIPDACAYPEFVQRFIREARAAVKIGGEHVARVTDVGRLESGAPYMVREFLRGPDLSEVLKVRGPLPVAEAVDYIIQAAEGVAEGHALGIVHRNLRMTTLVVTRRSDGSPLVKVFDFAAAEALHVDPFTERSVSLVGTSAIMSSLPYLSPEQIRDPHDVDVRADVYALGAILHELLTGQPVYSADNAPSLLASVAADAAAAVRELRPDVPGELDHVVLRCLAKNRAIRYPTVAELVTALAPFGSRESAASVERVQRLDRHAAPVARPRSEPPPGAPVQWPTLGLSANGKSRGPTGTLVMQPVSKPTIVDAPPATEDVTVTQPLASYVPLAAERARSSTPPPLRASARPRSMPAMPQPEARHAEEPAHDDVTVAAPTQSAPTPSSEGYAAFAPKGATEATAYAAPHRPPTSQTRTTMMPPARRSSLPGGMARSWAVGADAEETDASLRAKRRRNVGLGVGAAVATLAVFAFLRPPAAQAPSAAAQAPVAAPPTPAPAPAPTPVAPAAEAAAPAAPSIAPSVVTAAPSAAPPAPVAAAPVAAAPVAAAPVAAAPVAAAPVAPAPRPAAAPRAVAAPGVRAASSPPRTPPEPAPEPRAAATPPTKLASAPAGRDLFDSPE